VIVYITWLLSNVTLQTGLISSYSDSFSIGCSEKALYKWLPALTVTLIRLSIDPTNSLPSFVLSFHTSILSSDSVFRCDLDQTVLFYC